MDRLPPFSTIDLTHQTLTRDKVQAKAPVILVLLRGLA